MKKKYLILPFLLFSTVFITENAINNRLVRKGLPQSTRAIVSFLHEVKTYQALKKRKVQKIDKVVSFNDENVFVLIIGESCNRNHMALYAYSRNTNPKLAKRKDIVVYKNVISPYSNTLASVLSMLTESNMENQLSYDKSISLLDIFHSAGYKTYWISNQAPLGIWDSGTYNLAQTSDVKIFTNNSANSSFESTYYGEYDEKIFKPFEAVIKDKAEKKFIVIHLMGSHSTYAKRYPAEFNRFVKHNDKKQKIINTYDNSVLYNDFIVDSLLNILATYSKNNIVASSIYLSDHGENVYDENENVGHDYAGTLPKSNIEVPFLIWLSPKFKLLNPEKNTLIETNTNQPFMLDDLFHAIKDLNKIESPIYIPEKSVFNSRYNSGRERILEDNSNYDKR